MPQAPTEERLSLDAELWLVEQLLFTAHHDKLVEELVRNGLTEAQAQAQLARIDRSPAMAQLRIRLEAARRAEGLARLHRRLDPPPTTVPTATSVDRGTLWRDHWVRGRPLHVPAWGAELAPVQRWTFPWLRATLGDAAVQVNVDRDQAQRAADVEQRQAEMRFGQLLDHAQGPPSDARYAVSRNGLLAQPALEPLWDDLVGLPAPLVDPEPPKGVSLWIGPAGTHTRAHFDPHNVWLVQVRGGKRVRFAPPPTPAEAGVFDGWYLREPLGSQALEVELGEGDALFLPATWLHEVHALAPSVTLSFLCFGWPNHFHFLGPTGSEDGGRVGR